MSELLKSFDSYGDFDRQLYFTSTFGAIASTIFLRVPLVATKENMTKVIALLKTSLNKYGLIFKNWNTEDSSNADFTKDFPYELVFKSLNDKGLIWVYLEDDTLSIDFMYECNDSNLENWMIDMNDQFRKKFGLRSKPTFKVLTKSHSNFETEDVRTEKVELDIKRNYNEDFVEIYKKIEQSLLTKKSGLILLYGKPGTGKTTYIKNLISTHQESNFIFVQNEFVSNLLDPDFISFLLKQRNSILVIEDAEKVITSRENLKQESVVSTILQLTDGLFSDYLNIKVICTFNTNLSKIDTALLRKGRIIAMYEFNPLSIQKTNELLNSIGVEASNKALTVAEIFNSKEEEYANITKHKIGF